MDSTYNISIQVIGLYKEYLKDQEKSANTISKYLRDIEAFFRFFSVNGESSIVLNKQKVIEFKEYLKKDYTISSLNSMLAAVNGFLQFAGCGDCCVRLLKCQRNIFRDERRDLTREEYLRLIKTAKTKDNVRLSMIMKTICATGIRVSELTYITVEAVKSGRADISCKGKRRVIFMPNQLRRLLLQYIREQKITSGYVFRTKSGKPIDRSNIWKDMKALCEVAGVEPTKVFPHNLRHLFARSFYALEKNIVHLADVLGHSSIETTRIYTISTGEEHARAINQLDLVILKKHHIIYIMWWR